MLKNSKHNFLKEQAKSCLCLEKLPIIILFFWQHWKEKHCNINLVEKCFVEIPEYFCGGVVENVNPVLKQRMHKGWIFDIQYWLLAMKADKYSNTQIFLINNQISAMKADKYSDISEHSKD